MVYSILSQSLFYWITYSYNHRRKNPVAKCLLGSQSLFYWITYSYNALNCLGASFVICLNPYFIGLPILIDPEIADTYIASLVSILILLDYLFLLSYKKLLKYSRLVSILILLDYLFLLQTLIHYYRLNIVSQSLFYWITYSYIVSKMFLIASFVCLNPYFIGLPILII